MSDPAERRFSRAAAAYQRGRPGWPAAAIAVEPSEAMRRVLVATLPDVDARAGTAEQIPLGDASVDAIFVAEAFHWFDGRLAVAEIARVLRPAGGLGLLWNVPLRAGTDWLAEVEKVLAPIREAGTPPEQRYASGHWRGAFEDAELFWPLREARLHQEQRLTRQGVVDQIASRSYVQCLPDETRAQTLNSIRRVLAEHPDTSAADQLVVPYRTEVCWTWRR